MKYGQNRLSSAKRGYGHRWRKARIRFLMAYPLCRLCQAKGLTVSATEVDHIIPKQSDDIEFWDTDNWQGLCEFCHKSKTAKFDKPDKHRVKVDGNRSPTTKGI